MQSVAPSEKPILFSGAMVRAILAGKKTQTRRLVKPQPIPQDFGEGGIRDAFVPPQTSPGFLAVGARVIKPGDTCYVKLPYGQVGDRLWVKETFMPDPYINSCASTIYRATETDPDRYTGHKWKPSIFMPRIRSRLTLEITAVRVERLQDISAKDIIAEGAVERPHEDKFLGKCPISAFDGKCYTDLKSLWAHGWESINGKGSWALNPWVWVIFFRRAAI